MSSTRHKFFSLYKQAAEFFLQVPKQSHFTEKGVLTPEEFVKCGDLLVGKCPTWKWNSGEKGKIKNYLPTDKQYLITKGVPCLKRCISLIEEAKDEEVVEDGWVTTHLKFAKQKKEEKIEDINEDDDDDIIDIDEFNKNVDDWEEEDDDSFVNTNIIKTRTYDLSISYDKYYQTPRVWLFGYDENGKSLTTKQTLEDIHGDYSNKTVTIEQHPHLNSQWVSIHVSDFVFFNLKPCKHAQLMKKMIDMLAEDEKYIRVDLYLFLFLKFISSVIPTILYDFTIQVDKK